MATVLTQVKMEKNENVMAARAASPPSFSGLSSGFEACHWLVRKQKPTNQRNAQKAGMDHHRHAKGKDKEQEDMCEHNIYILHFSGNFNPLRPTTTLQTGQNWSASLSPNELAGSLTANCQGDQEVSAERTSGEFICLCLD